MADLIVKRWPPEYSYTNHSQDKPFKVEMREENTIEFEKGGFRDFVE